MTKYALIAASVMFACSASVLLAQTETGVPTDPAPEAGAVAGAVIASSAPSAIDLQPLSFYIQQKDQASAGAELLRLRAKFPDWVPPTDLSKLTFTQPSTEIDTIYRQIAAGQLVEARASIASTQAAYSAWVPSPDMLDLLETAEGQIKLDTALDAGNASEALDIASRVNGLLRCDRINNAWRIAKAQEAQQANSAAVGTYRAIVNACTNIPDIIATLEKSNSVTSQTELTELFGDAKARFPDKAAELQETQAKLMLGRGGALAQITLQPDAKSRPRQRPTEQTTLVKPAAAETPAVAAKSAAPSGPIPSAATDSSSGSVSSIGGCRSLSEKATSTARLAERGWCAYNLDRPMDALAAFKSAEPRLNGAQRRDVRFGMALSYLKMDMTEEASRIAASTQLTKKQRTDTESIILNQRGVRAYKKKQYRKAIGYFNALEQISGHLRRDLAILRGYAYLNGGNVTKARSEFQILHDQLATPETRAALKAAGG